MLSALIKWLLYPPQTNISLSLREREIPKPKIGDVRVAKKTKGSGEEFFVVELFQSQYHIGPKWCAASLFEDKDGWCIYYGGCYRYNGRELIYTFLTAKEAYDVVKSLAIQKARELEQIRLNTIVSTEVVECCSTLPRKIN